MTVPKKTDAAPRRSKLAVMHVVAAFVLGTTAGPAASQSAAAQSVATQSAADRFSASTPAPAESAGRPAVDFAPAVDAAAQMPRLHSLIVSRGGDVVLERYFNGRDA